MKVVVNSSNRTGIAVKAALTDVLFENLLLIANEHWGGEVLRKYFTVSLAG